MSQPSSDEAKFTLADLDRIVGAKVAEEREEAEAVTASGKDVKRSA